MTDLKTAANTQLSAEERQRSILQLGLHKPCGSLELLAKLANTEGEDLEIRLHAIRALSWRDKHATFPHMIDFLGNDNPDLRREAVKSTDECNDSRLTLPLINLYNSLVDTDLCTRHEILEALKTRADPRAVPFLEEIARQDSPLARFAAIAYLTCKDNCNIVYTYIGKEADRKAAEGQSIGMDILTQDSMRSNELQKMIRGEKKGNINFATYVVRPKDEKTPFGNCKLTIAPRRSEHYIAAQGGDVLVAGELGIHIKTGRIKFASNQSGGFLPGASGFFWLRKAAQMARVELELDNFSLVFPPGGYCHDDFLRHQPLYHAFDKK